jgi:hypothetical protein
MVMKIKVEALPLHFLVLGALLDVYATFHLIIGESVILNAILLLIGTLQLTTHQRLDIDLTKKIYSEFYWLLGIKLNNYTETYQEITALVCSSGSYSQQYGKYNRRFISGTMYKGYIELKDQEPLFVGRSKSKQGMMKKLTKLSAQLKLPVSDKTNDEE